MLADLHLVLAESAAAANPASLFSVPSLVALVTLTTLEIVLGIDNVVFIAILADALPESQRKTARRVGLLLAMLARIGLLSAEDQILDLENGEGVAFHLSLLALAASATTCVAALAHALHSEYVECVFCSFVVPHSLAFAQLDCRPLPRLVARRGLLKTPSFSS